MGEIYKETGSENAPGSNKYNADTELSSREAMLAEATLNAFAERGAHATVADVQRHYTTAVVNKAHTAEN
jgi:hypothetical protein